ncbi:hypothetical protein [Catellatospora bangladeshensis]|uniref:Uncharacterized protein n=1 Tax=Catellatospora bangladeshensis TaxID=310355 RepID=A0A8J3JKT9_9ACTN|nr:hypothetical protein [Catellatospora bangladeshensis]GIF80745.1 hypothetical protein Cba03nite_20940 [Catellatospora bangladeshensis]
MTGTKGEHRDGRWRGWGTWRVLRIALVGAWCLWAVAAWWSAPRPAEADDARTDIAAGQVTVYQWADKWERPMLSSWGTVPELRSWGHNGPLFIWRTNEGRTYYAVADAAPADRLLAGGGAEPSRPQTEAIRAAVMASLLDTARPLHGDIRPASRYLPMLIGLICLAIIVRGPAPALGTRWYWFWLTTGVPLGLGVLAWLAIERPWSARPGPMSEPDVDSRHRGLRGLLIAVAASVALAALGLVLREFFGTWAFPEPLG